MAVFKCKMCGGTIEFNQGDTVGVCDSCGTKQTLPKAEDDVTANLFNRANNLRLKCEFDKAEQIYEKIVEKDDSEAEAHWGIVLCKYGIEYVEDPKTGKRIPTCHRTLFEAVTADPDYQAAVDYADPAQQTIYESEARAIDHIQKDILAIVKNEKPFDVFLCYKETDENGKRTVDSTIANDIYYQLTQEGFKVFYAAITLEDKLGQEYEPYIFAALNSAKVMLVIGTKPEYFNAVWVKNEWSRFMNFMKTDRSKLLIPCYRDMDAYDLPEEFAHLQAQDMSKIGFINDVVRGIKKVLAKETPKFQEKSVVKDTVVSPVRTNAIEPLLKRAFMFLEDGKWKEADDYCEKVLDQDPENATAYLGKLMAELQVKKQAELADCEWSFDNRDNFSKVIRFGDEKTVAELRGYIKHINERNENERLEGIYEDATDEMNVANTEEAYKSAAEMFQSIADFKDAGILAEKCLEKAEICRKDTIYDSGKSKIVLAEGVFSKGRKIEVYEETIKIFQMISGWKDAEEQIRTCQRKIEEIKVQEEADRLEAERKAEEFRIAEEKKKKVKVIVGLIVAACLVFAFVLITVIIPNNKYNAAVALMDEGNYNEAIAAFKAMDGYKDSADKVLDCRYNAAISLMNNGKFNDAYESFMALDGYKDSATKAIQCKLEKLKNAKVGDIVSFGAYEQDNDMSNGKEDIEWIVLAKENGKAFVISKYALDCQQYNSDCTDVTWETCSLRTWMNGTFMNNAFSAEEQEKIATTNVNADKKPECSTNPGNATSDKVFLLSIAEGEKYFMTDESRMCAPTAYAMAQGAHTSDRNKTASGEAACWWWLRSPGNCRNRAVYVNNDGSVSYYGDYVDLHLDCVRPALWINLDS